MKNNIIVPSFLLLIMLTLILIVSCSSYPPPSHSLLRYHWDKNPPCGVPGGPGENCYNAEFFILHEWSPEIEAEMCKDYKDYIQRICEKKNGTNAGFKDTPSCIWKRGVTVTVSGHAKDVSLISGGPYGSAVVTRLVPYTKVYKNAAILTLYYRCEGKDKRNMQWDGRIFRNK